MLQKSKEEIKNMKLEDMRKNISENTKISELIKDYIDIAPENGRAVCDCPFCKGKNSFAISDSKNKYRCFECYDENDIVGFVAKYKHLSLDNACKEICEKTQLKYENDYSEEQLKVFDANQKAARYFYGTLRLNKHAQMYLKDRGLKKSTVKHFGLGYASSKWDGMEKSLLRHDVSMEDMKKAGLITVKENGKAFDRFRDRIIFPIIDEDNRILGFGGRTLKEGAEEAKYLNTATTDIFNKRNHLFALNFAKDSKHDGMILCEGYMDVISLHQAGYDNAVASLGTAFTTEHAYLIKQYTDKVYLSFDGDEAGIKAKLRAIPILRNNGLDVRVLNVSPHKDPDEFIKAKGREAFQQVLNKAVDSYYYELKCWNNKTVQAWLNIQDTFENKVKDVIARSTELDAEKYAEAYKRLTGTSIMEEEIGGVEEYEEEKTRDDDKDKILKNITDEYEIETP